MRIFLVVGFTVCLALLAKGASAQDPNHKARMTGVALDWAAENGRLRPAMQAFPKGADLHNHLGGAIYAETLLDWAAEDGLCADMTVPAIRLPEDGKTCAQNSWKSAAAVRADAEMRRQMINGLSNRSYVPTLNWSGHKDFFVTFERMTARKYRFGDKLAKVAARAASQNILYLELMETVILPELFPLVEGLVLTGDPVADYKTLMASPFGAKIPELVASIGSEIQKAQARKWALLGCDRDMNALGCDVEIQFIHQVVREFEPPVVFAQIMLGWAAIDQIDGVVGLNLVAPEDGYLALRDYSQHMRMIDYLYQTQGPRNVTLHAGELTLGLVRPEQLRSHIREAIEVGHALRIGHGVDIPYEDNAEDLAQKMADEGILLELNLTSNAVILGVSGDKHPIVMYRDIGVPYAISTDDEGVSRIDLTHEYMRFMTTYGVRYLELKYASRNSLSYSFLPGENLWDNATCVSLVKNWGALSGDCEKWVAGSKKAKLQWQLELRFRDYENTLRIPKQRMTSFN